MLGRLVRELFRRRPVAGRNEEAPAEDRHALFRHAIASIESGALGRARQYLERVVALDPHHADALHELGCLAVRADRTDEAADWFLRAISVAPGLARSHNAYGNLLYSRGELAEAARQYGEAIRIDPDLAVAHANMGMVLCDAGDTEAGLASLRKAVALDPKLHEAHNSMGIAYASHGDVATGIASMRRAVELKPDSPDLHSNLIMTLGLDAGVGNAAHLRERRLWQERHVEPLRLRIPRHDNTPDVERRIRVGYISADFRDHSAAFAFGPMLLHYDRDAFEVLCYSNSPFEDDFTVRYRNAVDCWRDIYGVPDADAEQLLRRDRIDILVDLSGHTVGNRLLLFARKPAPIQVTAWGGLTGTGLDAMDYIFADEVLIPRANRCHFSEDVVHLPCCLTYMPQMELPPLARLPATERGCVTFGYFNNYIKLSPRALGLWAKLLASLPGSRILLKAREFEHVLPRERVLRAFAAAGVAADQVSFLGRTPRMEHLAAHGSVDIALDPFPNVGGISTLEALAMGTPVVTLMGEAPVNRIAASSLVALGLRDWIADTPERYLALAREKAQDVGGLEQLRNTLRERLLDSPAGDPQRYALAVEAEYRRLWRCWCEAHRR